MVHNYSVNLKMDNIRFITLNVRGLGSKDKRAVVFKFLKMNAYDIVCLQETHSNTNVEQQWLMEWGSKIIFSHGSTNARGTAILFSKCLSKHALFSDITNHEHGRFNIASVCYKSFNCILCNLYGPNIDDTQLFTEIIANLRRDCYVGNKIIVGDFNTVLDASMDRLENKQIHPAISDVINDLKNEFQLCDPWRARNPNKIVYSWQRFFKSLSASRIDYSLVSEGVNNQIYDIEYCTAVKTDHQAMYINFQIQETKRGPGLWRFNNLLLDDLTFCEYMINMLKTNKNRYKNANPIDKWECIKCDIVNLCRKYSKDVSIAKNKQLNEWQLELNQLQIQLNNNAANEIACNDLYVRYCKIVRNIEQFYEDKARSSAFRARAQWLGEGEKNSKYFFALERANYNTKCMSMLRRNDGTIECEPSAILHMQKDYYEQLYTSDPNVSFNLKNNTEIKVDTQKASLLELPITQSEIRKALFCMKNDRAPGCDGISINLYKKFWSELCDIFYEMTVYSIESDMLPTSMSKGYISLLPKKSKDPLELRNWRPLTLLNNDYKIISKVLALRIKDTLDDIISEDQTGFMAGRQISVNIRKTFDAIEYLENNHKSGYILNLDYVKCFRQD